MYSILCVQSMILFYLPGGGVSGRPEWSLPAHEVQTEQVIFFWFLHHSVGYFCSCQCCIPIGQWGPRLLAELQGFHLSARTGKVVSVCMNVGICMCIGVQTVPNKLLFSSVCLSASCGLLSGKYGFSVGLFPCYKGIKVQWSVITLLDTRLFCYSKCLCSLCLLPFLCSWIQK